VRRLKEVFPRLPIVVNGGLRQVPAVLEALSWCDGVMLGREVYHRPFVLAELHRALHPSAGAPPAREALLGRMRAYAERELAQGARLAPIVRHMLGLYAGEPGAREFRRTLSEGARAIDAGPELLLRATPAVIRAQP
jgi:tRNA-dihydrouridine synthase A